MILVFTTGESIGPTGDRSPVVTLLKNALVGLVLVHTSHSHRSSALCDGAAITSEGKCG